MTGIPYETSMVDKVYDHVLKYKNIIIVGGKLVGKHTILMQLARKVKSNNKLFIKDTISKEEANFIISKLNNEDTWIFLAKGALDPDYFCIFSDAKNIHLISIAEEYS